MDITKARQFETGRRVSEAHRRKSKASVPARPERRLFVFYFDLVRGASGFGAVSRQLFTIVMLTPRISPLELI
jgi:hypothetical protein